MILPEFDFGSVSTDRIAIIGNSAEKHNIPKNIYVIRFNDWSTRTHVDKTPHADLVFSNGDSHAHMYGKGVKWPSSIVFVRRAGGLVRTIPKYYPAFKSLHFMKKKDHDTAQAEIKSTWATVGYIIAYNFARYFSGDIYVSGFTWELGKDRMYNHHDWEAERAWFKNNQTRFIFSHETKRALCSL